MLTLLRGLADRQDIPALQAAAAGAWSESADPACLVLLAFAQAQLGERDEAEQSLATLAGFETALDLDARVDLAAVWLLTGRVAQARDLLEAAVTETPAHALALGRLAWAHQRLGDDETAMALYRRSAAAQPSLGILLNLGRLLLRLARPDEARDAIAQAGALSQAEAAGDAPPPPQQRLQLALLQLELWLASGQQARAEAWLEVQREVLPPDAWCALVQGHADLLAAQDAQAQAEDLLRSALRHRPDHPPLYRQLAQLAVQRGSTQQAITLLRRAIRLADGQDASALALWLDLCDASLQLQPALARQAAERAMALATGLAGDATHTQAQRRQWRAQATLALAQVEGSAQHYDAAEALYGELLVQEPKHLQALLSLGLLHMQVGRLDEAIALFQRASEIDPVRGHVALINARQFPQDEATLERLEQLARRHGTQGRPSHGLLFALAAAWEKRGDHARAFALAEAANTATRKTLAYDPKAHRQMCAVLRHAFSSSLYTHRRGLGNPSTLPVFVVGMPRSGTTLVEQILAGHSRIHGAGELSLVPSTIAGLERWERRVGSGRGYPDCVDDLSPNVAAGITERMLDELRAYAPQASHVVDKLPHNFENIGLIKLLFPRARIISVQRDARDIAVSNYFTDFAAKHQGMGFAYDQDWIGQQLADHNLLMRHWMQLFPGEILEVRYEDVVADPETQARRMLDYIGVDWEPQVLEFSSLERPVKTASVWQVRQPIYHSSTAKWRRYEPWLAPLIAATNRRITWEPITMAALPEPGLLEAAVAHEREGRLDDAERCLQQQLHHLPQHAAANFVLGLVWVRKGHLADGIERMEQALERCPWNANWRRDMVRACALAGTPERAARWQAAPREASGVEDALEDASA